MSSTRRKGKQNKHKGKKKKKRKERTGQTFERGGPGDHDQSGAVNYVVKIDGVGRIEVFSVELDTLHLDWGPSCLNGCH